MADTKDGNPLDFLLPTGVNAGLNLLGNFISGDSARKNLDYQMDRYYSPQAQVRNLAAAGINPAVAFGNQSPVFSGGGSFSLPQNPLSGIGTQSMTDVANYLTAKANAVKAGADTEKSLAEADAIKLQNDLTKEFGRKNWILDVSQKYQNVILAQKTNDIKEQEKAINEFKKAAEKAISESKGIEKNMLQKRFDNLDVQIDLENKLQGEKINTEKSAQQANKASATASYAAARSSNTQADINIELKKIHSIEREVLEAGKVDRINAYLAELREKKMLSDEHYQELRQRIRSIKNRQDYADTHEWYGDFLNTMDDLSYYLSKFNPLNMVKPTDIAPSK